MFTTVIGKRSVLIQEDHIAVLVYMDITEMASSVKLPLPQTKNNHQTNKQLLLLLLCVGVSSLLLLFVVVVLCYVAVCKSFDKTIDVTSITL